MLAFPPKERDAESGLDYFGARYYASGSGRFTTVDPLMNVEAALTNPQRWNRYAYAANRPLVMVDPDGRDIVPVWVTLTNGRQRLTYVDSRIAEDFTAFVSAAKERDVEFTFNNVFRTPEEQDGLSTGNTKNTIGTSPHLVGLAFDINVRKLQGTDLAGLTDLAAEFGFSPLKNQKNDPPHFQANKFITRGKDGKVDDAYKQMLELNQRQYQVYEFIRENGLGALLAGLEIY